MEELTMPKKNNKIDYTTQPISFYRFVCEDENITSTYVGHTSNFTRRKSEHKKICNCNNVNDRRYNLKVYKTIRENGGWDNWRMIEIKNQLCESKRHAEKIEQELIEQYKSELNSHKAFRTSITEYYKQYNLENKQKIAEKNRQYEQQNKEKIKERKKQYRLNNKEKIAEINKRHYLNNPQEHKQYYQDNKEKIVEKQKQYYQDNKEKIKKRREEYLDKTKEKRAEQRQLYYQNNKEKIAERKKQNRLKKKMEKEQFNDSLEQLQNTKAL